MKRKNGTCALGMTLSEGRYLLNTGEAYGGEMFIKGPIRLRLSKGRNELPMLREHDRTRIIGAWTGVVVEGRSVVAAGIRWAETEDAKEAKALVDGGFVHAASIGFSAQWTYRDQLKPADLDTLAREGADLARLSCVLTDVEVYEASLVAVGADGNARWAQSTDLSEGDRDDPVFAPAGMLMLAHLQREHGMSEVEAIAAILAPVPTATPAEPSEEPPEAPQVTTEPEDMGALFDVPDGIREAARRGLEWREQYGRGGTASGVRTARALSSGRVGPELLITIAAWWARFSKVEGPMEDDDGEPTALAIARALWGGDGAKAWADSLRDDAEKEAGGEMAADVTLSREGGTLHLLPSPAKGWWFERLPARAGEVQ